MCWRRLRGLLWMMALMMAPLAHAQDPAGLRPVIDARYSDVRWVSTTELATELAGDDSPVLLDVRTAAEFAVSHLRGARRVDPDDPQLGALGLSARSRVVVYCSVGYRSAAIVSGLRELGVTRVRNLLGGIFAWANEGRSLFRGTRQVQKVHPYDDVWGRLLVRERRAPI